mmetsp:Transcript_20021/g.65048  ORF Transcript_20021/g.65048 Transcript_20021/m.65048 type:complete len:235 (+) Transcript_20021:1565-2269(+)
MLSCRIGGGLSGSGSAARFSERTTHIGTGRTVRACLSAQTAGCADAAWPRADRGDTTWSRVACDARDVVADLLADLLLGCSHRVCREGEADGGGLGIGITTDADGAVGGGDGARHRVESNSVRHSRGQVRLVPGLEDAHALLIGEHLEAERVEVGDQDVQHVVLQAGGDADVGVRSAVLEGVGHDLVQGELGHGDVDGDEASDGRYQRAAAGQGGLQERDEGHGRAVGDVGVLL